MYVKRDKEKLKQVHFTCLEDLVPENHLLREIDAAIDWNFIYDEVQGLYKEEIWGKPGIDPVSLIKIVMLQYIYGIPSMRQTIREIEVNNAYRWFIGYDIGEPVPHFTTFGKDYTRRFAGTDIFERISLHAYCRRPRTAALWTRKRCSSTARTSRQTQIRRNTKKSRLNCRSGATRNGLKLR